MTTTNWTPWLLEKTRAVVIHLSHALAAGVSPEAARCIHSALHDACKLHVHAVELDTGASVGGLHERLAQHIQQHPEQTAALLASFHERARKESSESATPTI